MRVAYGFLIFTGIAFLALSTTVPVIKSSAEFSMLNPDWNGCSEFAKMLNGRGKIIPLIYPFNSAGVGGLHGTVLIIGPDVGYSAIEVDELKAFLENGGTVLISDDFGTGNDLLEKLGLKARFSKIPVKDIFYSKRMEFPVVVRIEDPELAIGVERLVLNIPSAIMGLEGEAFSSRVSVVGRSMKSYPVLAEVSYGRGKIILLSDPGVLINDMQDENRRFVENLVQTLPPPYYYDEAHHSDFNPYSLATVYIHRELDRGKAFQVFLVVFLMALLVETGMAGRMMRSLPRKKRNLFEELEDIPEWVDRKILERMLKEMETGSRLGERYGR